MVLDKPFNEMVEILKDLSKLHGEIAEYPIYMHLTERAKAILKEVGYCDRDKTC